MFRKRHGNEWVIDLPLYEDEDGETYLVRARMSWFPERSRTHTACSDTHTDCARVWCIIPQSILALRMRTARQFINGTREDAYLKAETEWVRISANKALGGYDVWTPETIVAGT